MKFSSGKPSKYVAVVFRFVSALHKWTRLSCFGLSAHYFNELKFKLNFDRVAFLAKVDDHLSIGFWIFRATGFWTATRRLWGLWWTAAWLPEWEKGYDVEDN